MDIQNNSLLHQLLDLRAQEDAAQYVDAQISLNKIRLEYGLTEMLS